MTATGTDLLRLLNAQGTPGLSPGVANSGATGAIDFAKLLSRAQEGTLPSGRDVTIAKGCPARLSDDQLKRLTAAADAAESQGATRAVVLIDGMAVKLDVSMREVTGTFDMSRNSVLTGIDAVVQAPPSQNPGAAQVIAKPPMGAGLGTDNASLISALLGKKPGSDRN